MDRAQEMYEHLGEPEDAWANLCPETEISRDECIMERNSDLNTDDVADTIPDIKHESTKRILYITFNKVMSQMKKCYASCKA